MQASLIQDLATQINPFIVSKRYSLQVRRCQGQHKMRQDVKESNSLHSPQHSTEITG
ncbi:hypothetical protein EXN66_Car011423 [Channa argus]|uniref:Uncharacterized protein n=1 Tax=Channa argus TaxID=215402 RepID=A0A6G1PZS2_CHAAH|nr:hypothetical protein EXN66_Car011423 [Channa argus]